ncbi:RNA-directed DNA polymerase, eukaryota, reverse transcriptase zinc-binding domain protein [Tanacetum coccineum]
MINIYGPHDPVAKVALWNRVWDLMQSHRGKYVLFGNMNEVRNGQERHGSIFSRNEVDVFNSFSNTAVLIDLPMGGRSFTWMKKSGNKISKMDRFWTFKDVLNSLPDICVTALDRLWPNHNPILLHCNKFDFGLEVVNEMKNLEENIKARSASTNNREARIKLPQEIDTLDSFEAMDTIQKARIKWDIKGEENTKFSMVVAFSISSNMNLTLNWKLLTDRFYAKLSTWKANLLSYGDRLTLIKVELGCLRDSQNTKKLAWLKWPNDFASLDKGGLDIDSLKSSELGVRNSTYLRDMLLEISQVDIASNRDMSDDMG